MPGALRRLVAGLPAHLPQSTAAAAASASAAMSAAAAAAAAASAAATATTATPKSVAVVGGGVAGLVCARELSARGHRVTVFDLGRAAPGGRASTRTTTWRTVQFDHGLQLLSVAAAPPPPRPPAAASSPSSPSSPFGALVEAWRREGLVAAWDEAGSSAGRVGVYDATTGAYAPRAVWAASGGAGAGAVGSASAAAAAGSAPPATAPNFFLELIAGRRPEKGASPSSLPRLYVGVPSTDALCKGLARGLEEEQQQQKPTSATTTTATTATPTIRQGVGVSRARFDPRARTWVLEGRAPEKPLRTHADRRATPAYTPWNEGAFDALVLADRMAGQRGTPGFVELEGCGGAGARLSGALAGVKLSPCLVLMLAYEAEAVAAGAGGGGGGSSGEAGADGNDANTAAASNDDARLPLPLDGWDAAAVVGCGAGGGKIAWVCRDASKPGRGRQDGLQTYVAVATPAFSAEVLAAAYSEGGAGSGGGRRADGSWPPQTPEYLSALVGPMRRALEEALRPALLRRRERRARSAAGAGAAAAAAAAEGAGAPFASFPEPAFAQVHRWGAAFPEAALGAPCLRADGAALAACGDFCLGGGVEGAALSGQAAAAAVAEMLSAASGSSAAAEGGGGDSAAVAGRL